MILELGKEYKSKDGSKVSVLKNPYISDPTDCRYYLAAYSTGKFHAVNQEGKAFSSSRRWDIVGEWTAPGRFCATNLDTAANSPVFSTRNEAETYAAGLGWNYSTQNLDKPGRKLYKKG